MKITTRKVVQGGEEITYILTRKPVKNINMRIGLDGLIKVSANNTVPAEYIDEFVLSRRDFIDNALRNLAERNEARKESIVDFTDARALNEKASEIQDRLIRLTVQYTIKMRQAGYAIPDADIDFKAMKSRWGSCNASKCKINYNVMLMNAPEKAVEYVVVHELSHFVASDHSPRFYQIVEEFMPDWKKWSTALKSVSTEVTIAGQPVALKFSRR